MEVVGVEEEGVGEEVKRDLRKDMGEDEEEEEEEAGAEERVRRVVQVRRETEGDAMTREAGRRRWADVRCSSRTLPRSMEEEQRKGIEMCCRVLQCDAGDAVTMWVPSGGG